MPSYGTSLGLTLPTVGQAAWGGSLNSILQTIIDVLQAKVTPSGLNVNATLDFGGNALTSLLYARFSANAANVSAIQSAWFKSDGEFYVTDGAGNAVQLTEAGSIKGTAGSIGGDYASSGASVTYTTAASAYFFYDHTGTSRYADVNVQDIKLHDGTTTNAVALASPSSLGASYTVIWPSGTIGSTDPQAMLMSNAGNISMTPNLSLHSFTGSISAPQGGSLFQHLTASYELVTMSTASLALLHKANAYQVTGSDGLFTTLTASHANFTSDMTASYATFTNGAKFSAAGTRLTVYEEGAWKPWLFINGTEMTALGGTPAGSYAIQTGSFQRLGSFVTVQGIIDFTLGTGIGPYTDAQVEIRGCPYTASVMGDTTRLSWVGSTVTFGQPNLSGAYIASKAGKFYIINDPHNSINSVNLAGSTVGSASFQLTYRI